MTKREQKETEMIEEALQVLHNINNTNAHKMRLSSEQARLTYKPDYVILHTRLDLKLQTTDQMPALGNLSPTSLPVVVAAVSHEHCVIIASSASFGHPVTKTPK